MSRLLSLAQRAARIEQDGCSQRRPLGRPAAVAWRGPDRTVAAVAAVDVSHNVRSLAGRTYVATLSLQESFPCHQGPPQGQMLSHTQVLVSTPPRGDQL